MSLGVYNPVDFGSRGEVNTRITEVRLEYAQVWLESDGIVRMFYHEDTKIDLDKAIEVGAALLAVCQGKSRPLYADARNIRAVSREGREYWASERIAKWSVAAATRNTPLLRALGNLYIKFQNPPYPLRFFASEAEAIKWLKGFLE